MNQSIITKIEIIVAISVLLYLFSGCIPKPYSKSQEAGKVLEEFPFLGKLLIADNPWEMEPQELADYLFHQSPTLMQGNKAYPLLYRDQREQEGWPGEKVFNLYAYETEYYSFDKANPVLKLHIGRPLVHSQQHARVEEVAKSRHTVSRFPYLAPEEIPPFLHRLDSLVEKLIPYGAKKEKSYHYLTSCYRLPNGIKMNVTNYSGSTNGTPYVEITLTPEKPVKKFEGTQTLAFPGAEGFGRYSVGGRGGKVYIVTSLKDYLPEGRKGRPAGEYGQASEYALTLEKGSWKPYIDALGNPHPNMGVPLLPAIPDLPAEEVITGTLREAIEAEGPRYVVFAVSGDIELKDELVIQNPYITIAGQSAPGEGIQLKNWGIRIDTHDVILRHLRIRVGEIKGPGNLRRTLGEQTHGLDANGMNIIIDHCDIAYANDQILNTYGSRTRQATTIQWCYIYGAPTQSTHEKGDHSMTMTGNGWGYVSFHHNLIAHGGRRNPRLDMLTYDFRNNVIYNFTGTGYGSDNDYLRLNYIGNTLKKGPDSKNTHLQAFRENTVYGQWYEENNKLPDDFTGVFGCPQEVVIYSSHLVPSIRTHTPEEAYELILENGGVTKPIKDEITSYVAKTVQDSTGTIPATPDQWPGKGFAHYKKALSVEDDRNQNGIPDHWEISKGLDLQESKTTGRDLDSEYDNIEVYLNSL